MKKAFSPIIIILCLSLMATQCDEDQASFTQVDEQNELLLLKKEIETLANRSVCNEFEQMDLYNMDIWQA
mgnify:CR=1 FL=1